MTCRCDTVTAAGNTDRQAQLTTQLTQHKSKYVASNITEKKLFVTVCTVILILSLDTL